MLETQEKDLQGRQKQCAAFNTAETIESSKVLGSWDFGGRKVSVAHKVGDTRRFSRYWNVTHRLQL